MYISWPESMVRFPQAAQVAYTFAAHRAVSIRRAMYVVRFHNAGWSLSSRKRGAGESTVVRWLSIGETGDGWVVTLRCPIRLDSDISNDSFSHPFVILCVVL